MAVAIAGSTVKSSLPMNGAESGRDGLRCVARWDTGSATSRGLLSPAEASVASVRMRV